MAGVKSLGLHRPSALPYLAGEGILPTEPSENLYKWQTNGRIEGVDLIEEEILVTQQCVVWSRCGAIKRIFNLEVEGESILHAFVTSFPVSKKGSGHDYQVAYTNKLTATSSLIGPRKRLKTRLTHPDSDVQKGGPSSLQSDGGFPETKERALVVILRSQAHIYFLSGSSHVIPLPFEVETAYPTVCGFVLQRRLNPQIINPPLSVTTHIPNLLSRSLAEGGASYGLISGTGKASGAPSLKGPNLAMSSVRSNETPRTFTFTEPHSELGLVDVDNMKQGSSTNIASCELNLLSQEEEVIYISPCNECEGLLPSNTSLLNLAVTMNDMANTYTVWHVTYHPKNYVQPSKKRRKLDNNENESRRRRSSNIFGRTTGTATPVNRGYGRLRDSFGAMAQSQAENIPGAAHGEQRSSQAEELAAQLGPDFGDVGVQTRAARRVSSMLARTDLSMGHERATFTELTVGQPGRKSISRSIRQGESLGGFSDRQSFGARRRSSFPGNSSIFSNGTSFLETPVDRLLEELSSHGDHEGLGSMGLDDSVSDLRREVTLSKVETIPRGIVGELPLDFKQHLDVFTILSPVRPKSGDSDAAVSICIMNKASRELIMVNLIVRCSPTTNISSRSHRPSKPAKAGLVRAVDLRRGSNIIAACKVGMATENRILILTHTRDGRGSLSVEAPWGVSFRVDLPTQMSIYDPFSTSPSSSPDQRKEVGLRRVMRDAPNGLIGIESPSIGGRVSLIDGENRKHRVQLQLDASDQRVQKILSVCKFVLQGKSGDGVLVCWWEVLRWLESKDQEGSVEWTAMVVVLFSMAIPYIGESRSPNPLSQRRKKTGLLRSSSGSTIDMASWEAMAEEEIGDCDSTPSFITGSAWRWITAEQSSVSSQGSHPASSRSSAPLRISVAGKKNAFLLRCANLAREFLQTPAGETAIGPEGYLPTAMNKDLECRRTALSKILLGLHLLREEQKLDIRTTSYVDAQAGQFAPILAQLGGWLGWLGWSWKKGSYYATEVGDADQWVFDDTRISVLDVPVESFDPPSILAYAETSFQLSRGSRFLTLVDLLERTGPSSSSAENDKRQVEKFTPRTFALCNFLTQMQDIRSRTARVELLRTTGITSEVLETLPSGIAVPLHEAIVYCQANPPTSWADALLELIDRDDTIFALKSPGYQPTPPRFHTIQSHEAQRDYHGIGNVALDTESFHSWDASSEADRQNITRMIFRDDRRFQEASKLVNQLRPPIAECTSEPEWTESDLLEAQKDLVYHVTRRTLAVSSGRGLLNFSARVPLLTEKVFVPAFTLQCTIRPRNITGVSFNAVTLSAERAAFTEEKVCWAFFHNGASTGLMISKEAKGIDTSWILFNKPLELTNRHAGFLLALGLNGHLKALAKWVAFKYLTPKHTMTSIGLLLGLSASYIGTMDTLITRLLSVHVTRLLPPGAAELNLSPLTQTAGIMGVGLLYCFSQHRRMSEVMLSEIENTDPEEGSSEETILRDEGYRLAAGFSLGLINLGQGNRLHSLHDMSLVERLLTVAIGTKNVNLVHVLDRSTAGATIALALIFMKTEDESIAKKIDIPDTTHQFDYVRPDIFLLRTVARHLIMWSRIRPSSGFIRTSLPKAYKRRSTLKSTRQLSSEDMPFFNIVAGICLSIGLRFAGSAYHEVRDLLVAYLDQYIRLTRLPALNYDAKLTRNSLRNCQDVVALAVAAVMAGTGDLVVFRRLRCLHGRVDAETPYGSHLATHMAIGALFLGGGTHTFGTGDLAVASLLCAFYPLFPTSVLDNRSHLQALRHLWVLAVEPRCLIPRDVDNFRPISVPLTLTLKNGLEKTLVAPCLLPEFSEIDTIKTSAPEYWDVVLDFTQASGTSTLSAFKQNQSVFLRRRPAYDAPASSLFVSALQASADSDPTPSVSATAATSYRYGQTSNPLEWLFGLETFWDLDMAEKALVLPPHGYGCVGAGFSTGNKILRATVVDTRLELENTILDDQRMGTMTKDGLWQLRLLFAWADELDRERQYSKTAEVRQVEGEPNGPPTWLRREVVEGLKWRVWKMGGGSNSEEAMIR